MRGAVFFALSLLAGCKDKSAEKRKEPDLAPLVAPATTALAVAGFGDAVVVPPSGATKSMPILVAVLGIGDSPEEQCAAWRELVGGRAFVLCPRGQPNMVAEEGDPEDAGAEAESDEDTPKPTRDAGKVHQIGYYPVDIGTLEREVSGGINALKARFKPYVDDRDVVYVGFSRGAYLGASLVARQPQRFTRAVLIEGGQSAWRTESAAAFAKGGGKRVLFACGQPACVSESETAASTLRGARLDTRVIHGEGEGHGYKKQVKEELRRSFDWVTEGDPRWAQLVAR